MVRRMLTALLLAVPLAISHQGRLLGADDKPATGAVDLKLALYAAAEGGDAVWSASFHVQLGPGGTYSVMLDDAGLAAAFAGDRWLGVTVGTDAEMSPRMRFGSVPFAFYAGSADEAATVGGEAPAALHDAAKLTGALPAAALAPATAAA